LRESRTEWRRLQDRTANSEVVTQHTREDRIGQERTGQESKGLQSAQERRGKVEQGAVSRP
jgi:hypothetical protein